MQPKIFEVVLKILMHCEGCAEDIKYRIHKMQGTSSLKANYIQVFVDLFC